MLEDSFYYVNADAGSRADGASCCAIAAEKEPNAESRALLDRQSAQPERRVRSWRSESHPAGGRAQSELRVRLRADPGFMLTKLGHAAARALEKIDYAIWLSPSDALYGQLAVVPAHRTDLKLGEDRAAHRYPAKGRDALSRQRPEDLRAACGGECVLGNTRAAADFAAKFQKLAGPNSADALMQELIAPRFVDQPELLYRLQQALGRAE